MIKLKKYWIRTYSGIPDIFCLLETLGLALNKRWTQTLWGIDINTFIYDIDTNTGLLSWCDCDNSWWVSCCPSSHPLTVAPPVLQPVWHHARLLGEDGDTHGAGWVKVCHSKEQGAETVHTHSRRKGQRINIWLWKKSFYYDIHVMYYSNLWQTVERFIVEKIRTCPASLSRVYTADLISVEADRSGERKV